MKILDLKSISRTRYAPFTKMETYQKHSIKKYSEVHYLNGRVHYGPSYNNLQTVFELRNNLWLSQGQPGYDFRLSVQVCGCLNLEHINIILCKGDFLATALWLSVGQLHQYFWLSGDFFCCPGRTNNRNFERCR